jgi:hypothetical protein
MLAALLLAAAPPMAVIDERDVMRREPVPHGAIGTSTAWRISDAAPQPRRMEFRRGLWMWGPRSASHHCP